MTTVAASSSISSSACFRVKREEQCKELKAELEKLGQKYFTMFRLFSWEDFHDSRTELLSQYDDLGQKIF